jgi:glycosyltransferase involved in cell wall biosynthesis
VIAPPRRHDDDAAARAGRLAIFLPSLGGGGAERAALKLAGGLADRGHAVDLVLATAAGPFLTGVPPRVRVVDLGASRVLRALPSLVRYLRRTRPVALTACLNHANIVAVWARALARCRCRLVVVEHNTLSETSANGATRRDRAMPALARRFYPWADYVVGVSADAVDDLAAVTHVRRDRLCVILNPVVADDLIEQAQSPPEHPWFEEATPVLVAAGRLRPQKDFPTLLRAFATLRTSRRARLVIFGEGPDRSELLALATALGVADDVAFPGFSDNVYAYMAHAAAFVLSSRWEGLPTVLIEALACRAPVIATDCPSGPREILAGGRYGRLVPVGNVDALAGAMRAAVDGEIPPPPDESWRPYEVGAVVDRYLEVMLGP